MSNTKKITILHSNDLHGDFLAEKVDDKIVGGVSMLSGYINKVRAKNRNTVYCIAGDMFRGSVIDSEYLGMSTVEIMNMLSPDVVAVGNHEVDYGIAHLLFIEKCASFPIINANMKLSVNGARLFSPCEIIERDGLRVLFIGIITEDVLAQTRKDGLIGSVIRLSDAVTEIGKVCNAYNASDIDLTVLLTHIGYAEDKKLAAQLDPAWGVDVIIGGHSHTYVTEPEKINDILIVQAGMGTDQIGRFDIEVDCEENRISDYQWQLVPINPANCPRDRKVEKLVRAFKEKTDEKYLRVLSHFMRPLTHPDRIHESELGAFFSDILTKNLGVDIMLLASGSIRSESLGPIVTLADVTECLPFDEPVNLLKVTGEQLIRMIRHMLRDEIWEGIHCEFYQLPSKMRVVYDRATHEFVRFDINGRPVNESKLYTIALQQYHLDNFDNIFSLPISEVLRFGAPRMIATSCRDVIEEYLTVHSNISFEMKDILTVL